jgi:methyltransferase (TIGR00027 family)
MIATSAPLTAREAIEFSDVESTALLTLYARAMESLSPDPILVDKAAEHLVDQIDELIADREGPLLRMLFKREVDPRLPIHIALRAGKYDQYAKDFLTRNPYSVIVNLGCGMDTRFQRIDNGRLIFFDLDLPDMIRFKHSFLAETEVYHMIASSVFDERWMDQVASTGSQPVLFLAEGLFMYLDPEKVRRLVLAMQSRFPGSELVCEVVSQRWVSGIWKKIASGKMQRQLKLGKGTEYNFGLTAPDEMESWQSGIEFIDRWSYFESNHPKLGWMRIFSNIRMMNEVQYTVHYRLS